MSPDAASAPSLPLDISTTRAARNSNLAQARGALALAGAGFGQITARIHEIHRAISDIPFRRLAQIPGVAAGSAVTRATHDGITDGVYAAVRGIGALLFHGADSALRYAETHGAAKPVTRHAKRDDAVSAINGMFGDAMARERNPLALRMGFYSNGTALRLQPQAIRTAYPAATPRLLVFVHGLCCNESAWRLYQVADDPRTQPYGERLAAQGYTPLYLRYNTGLHVSQNGRSLAWLMRQLADAYPVAIEEIVLIGHSMGGLVARSACYAGARNGAGWVRKVQQVICLGSPHLGAPLEKVVHVGAAVLDAFALGRPWARALNARSLGIKDLRYGYVADADWRGRDPDALLQNGRTLIPRLPHTRYHFIGSTLGAVDSPLSQVIGDGMVRLPSATARELADADTAVLCRLHHVRLLNDPTVYDEIDACLAASGTAARSKRAG